MPQPPVPDETRLRRKLLRDDILKLLKSPHGLAQLAFVLLLWAALLGVGAALLRWLL